LKMSGDSGKEEKDVSPDNVKLDMYGEQVITVEKRAEECPIVLLTIYGDCGEVKRIVNFDAEAAGHYEVILRGITTKANLDHVRIIRGTGPATLLELQSSRLRVPVGSAENIDQREAEYEALKEKLEQMDREISACQTQKEIVGSIANGPKGPNADDESQSKNSSLGAGFLSQEYLENARRFMDFIQNDMMAAGNRLNALKREREVVHQQFKEAESLLNKVRGEVNKIKVIVEVKASFEVSKPGPVSFAMSYLVSDVSWKNKYEFWVDSSKSTLDIKCSALVKNTSGEDWPETDVILSTASPVFDAAPDEHQTTFVSYHGTEKYPPSIDSHGDTILGGDGTSEVALRSFNVKSCSLIECDGVEHEMTTLVIKDIPMESFYTVAPRASTNAYSILSAKNTSNHVLLGGAVAVFIDGSFVCQSSMKYLAPGEAFEVSLGVDKDVKIDYTEPIKHTSHKGVLMFKKNIKTFSGFVVVTNNKTDKPITIRIRDQLPRSNDRGIVVSLTEETLKDKFVPRITEENLLEWKFKLDASEKVKVLISFTVKHPDKRDVRFQW